MNDIEVLEELLKKKKCDIGYYMVYIFDDREKQAIENLLKERQSDKDRIKDLEEINEAHKKENGELRERVNKQALLIKELEQHNYKGNLDDIDFVRKIVALLKGE